MTYPDSCARGISHCDCLENESLASINLFPFPKNRTREDGWIPESINWIDDQNVIEFTLGQTKDNGDIQFQVGVAIILRDELDRLKKHPGFNNSFDYERNSLANNKHHGNILIKESLPKRIIHMIRSLLASNSIIHLRG